jgi:chromosome segregation ATPase
MTTISDLPNEVEKVADLIRTVFGREISKGRKAVDELNSQAATAQTTLTDLRSQIGSAQAQLSSVHANLHRGSTLAGYNTELRAVSSAVEKLTAEKAGLETSVADLAKQRAKLETEVAGLSDDARMYRAERADFEGAIDRARALANNWRTTA